MIRIFPILSNLHDKLFNKRRPQKICVNTILTFLLLSRYTLFNRIEIASLTIWCYYFRSLLYLWGWTYGLIRNNFSLDPNIWLWLQFQLLLFNLHYRTDHKVHTVTRLQMNLAYNLFLITICWIANITTKRLLSYCKLSTRETEIHLSLNCLVTRNQLSKLLF